MLCDLKMKLLCCYTEHNLIEEFSKGYIEETIVHNFIKVYTRFSLLKQVAEI